MSVPEAATDPARRDWYRQAIASDPERRERFAAALSEFDATPGKSDNMDELDRLLDQ